MRFRNKPILVRAMAKIATARTLTIADLSDVVEAAVLLGIAKLRVSLRGADRRNLASQPSIIPHRIMDEHSRSAARRVRSAIGRAARNLPLSYNCLPQALAARTMLARRGVAASLHIGVEKATGGNRRFHAWLKVDRVFVTGECDEGQFVKFAASPKTTPHAPCEAQDRLASQLSK